MKIQTKHTLSFLISRGKPLRASFHQDPIPSINRFYFRIISKTILRYELWCGNWDDSTTVDNLCCCSNLLISNHILSYFVSMNAISHVSSDF